MLMEKGFITPVSLHYVRNHGAVPKLDWDTHKVKVLLCDTLYTLLQRSLPCPVCCPTPMVLERYGRRCLRSQYKSDTSTILASGLQFASPMINV